VIIEPSGMDAGGLQVMDEAEARSGSQQVLVGGGHSVTVEQEQ
jgi:hypothetical protein